MQSWLPHDTEQAARLLDAHPGYRVLRALPSLKHLCLPAPEGRVRTAVVLDVETTGLDADRSKIIELAMCEVQFDNCGRIVAIGPIYDWLEDPGEPLSPEICELTGLSDADLAGRRIDDEAAHDLLANASLTVAHNASFDVRWIERRYSDLAGRAWCCSLTEVDWRSYHYESRQLGGLLAEVSGFFNTRHRADADVAALVALLATTLPSGRTAAPK